MRPTVRPSFNGPQDEKNLIAEQPGRFVLFAGVLLAVTLGLILRGVTAPNKVKAMIESAASRIHKDVKVEFDGAQISLSRGLLPRFAVIITKVHMSSSNDCWMTPELDADEIRLPLSLSALVQGQNPITQVEAGQVAIRLNTPYKNCEAHPHEAQKEAPQVKQFVTLKNLNRQEEPPRPEVEAILIDQLRIAAPPLKEPLELNAFSIRLKSNTPRVIEMQAKTHLLRDVQVGDYLSHATVWGEYSEFPNKAVQARLSGNWREGSYLLNANYQFKEEELSSELDLKHIPLSQALQIFKKLHWLNQDLNARQVWVSLNAQMKAVKADVRKAEVQVKDLRLEGDLGDVRLPEVRVASLDPLKFSPFSVDIQRLNFSKLLALLNRPHPSAALGQLGNFTGTAEFTDEDHIEISGRHRGLEFIFSNKGQREVQTLSEVESQIKLEKGRWQMQMSRFMPEQGMMDGQMLISGDRDFKTWDLKLKTYELRFAPSVVRLMTAGGRLGNLSGDLSLSMNNGQMSQLKGHLNAEDLDVEGASVSKAKWTFDSNKQEIVTQAQAQRMTLKAGSASFQTVKDLIEPEWMNDGVLELKNLSSKFNIKASKALVWKNFSAVLDKGGRVTSDGDWNEEGDLSGQVVVSAGKATRRWSVQGRRDAPAFVSQDAAKKKK